jgi:hypothetical protein
MGQISSTGTVSVAVFLEVWTSLTAVLFGFYVEIKCICSEKSVNKNITG